MTSISINELDILFQYIIESLDYGVMLDVGGHFGESALPFLKKEWVVHSFEPDESNRKILTSNTGEFDNIFIHDFALSDTEGEDIPFYTSEESTGISSLLNFHHTHSVAGHVKTKRLDTFCIENSIENINFLKIDTEGLDYKILCGFDFQKMLPEIVLCEYDFNKIDNFTDIIEKLTDLNYTVLISEWDPIVKYGLEHSWHSFKAWPCELSNNMSWGNILAFKDSINHMKLCTAAMRSTQIAASKKINKQYSFTRNHYDKLIREFIKLKMENLKFRGIENICLFGAGKFTHLLMEIIEESDHMPLILSILDDNIPDIHFINEYPIKNPTSFNFDSVDAVVLSTDTHQDAMLQRCTELKVIKPVINIFNTSN